jgi:soluble lytic murein transglycosylase-like protein
VLLGIVLGCSTPSPESTRSYESSPQSIDQHIADASRRFDVPEEWIRAVMHVESGGRTHLNGRPITSHAGAMGLMQVMPATYVYLRDRYGLGHDPHHPRDNIFAGTAYMREMYDLFGSPGFLAAYNAGPGRYSQYIEDGRPLPGETRRYLDLIYPRIVGILPADGEQTRYANSGNRDISERPPRRPSDLDTPG